MNRIYKFIFAAAFIFVFLYSLSVKKFEIGELFYGVSLCSLSEKNLICANANLPYAIAIDCGHGGFDTGAQYIVDEIDVINQTGEFLYDLLESDENFYPIYTHTPDKDPESAQRCEIARQEGAALMISIHANCDTSQSSHGFECFPIPPGRQLHDNSLRFAKLITRYMKDNGHTLRGYDTKSGIKYAYYHGESKAIVECNDTKVRSRKSFGILEKSPCPAVLVEQCFITNYEDVENWATRDGCKKAATIYYKAICDYFGVQIT